MIGSRSRRRYHWARWFSNDRALVQAGIVIAALFGAAFLVLTVLVWQAHGYDRRDWGGWIDADQDGETTREEVLQRDRLPGGGWRDPYTGKIERDPSVLDLDHLVALGEAARSGGEGWIAASKRGYANNLRDPDHLVLTHRSVNRQKSDRDPAQWTPPDARAACWYGAAWTRIKWQWGLTMDTAERVAVVKLLAQCRRP